MDRVADTSCEHTAPPSTSSDKKMSFRVLGVQKRGKFFPSIVAVPVVFLASSFLSSWLLPVLLLFLFLLLHVFIDSSQTAAQHNKASDSRFAACYLSSDVCKVPSQTAGSQFLFLGPASFLAATSG